MMNTSFSTVVTFVPGRSARIPDAFVRIAGPRCPTLVAVHGISRNAAEIAMRFAAHPAFAAVNIVAPLFEKARFGQYQQIMACGANQVRADRALFALLDELGASDGIATDRLLLFGFSGGAQMTHRLAMLHPHRVSRLCAVAAGWYLLPDTKLAYPYGLGKGCPVAASPDALLDVPTTVIVGSRDTRIDASVRQDPLIVGRQGANRLRRARAWTCLMAERARLAGRKPAARLVRLANASHDFGLCARDAGLLDRAAEALLS